MKRAIYFVILLLITSATIYGSGYNPWDAENPPQGQLASQTPIGFQEPLPPLDFTGQIYLNPIQIVENIRITLNRALISNPSKYINEQVEEAITLVRYLYQYCPYANHWELSLFSFSQNGAGDRHWAESFWQENYPDILGVAHFGDGLSSWNRWNLYNANDELTYDRKKYIIAKVFEGVCLFKAQLMGMV